MDDASAGSAERDPYTRCPDCGFIAPPTSMDYALTPDLAGIDWTAPVRVTCFICHADHYPAAADVLPLDSVMTCKRCGEPVACPAGAARVRCTGCGLFLTGPDLTPAQRDELRIAEGLAGVALRETYLAARERARRREPRASSLSGTRSNRALRYGLRGGRDGRFPDPGCTRADGWI